MAMTDGIMPVYEVNGGQDSGFGGGNSWFFFLFIILIWGGNGIGGGFGGGNSAVAQTLSNDFLYQNLNGSIDGLASTVASGFTGVSNGLATLGYESLAHAKDLQAQLAATTCETNRNIDAVRYENARNTCDIISANEKNTDRILAHLTATEIQSLRDNLNTANMQLSQQAQSANLIGALRPSPMPAYITHSPYESTFGIGCTC